MSVKIKFGIEHEFVFKNSNDEYIDFENASYETFQKIVDNFPSYIGDELIFECKSLEKSPKRCYIEGIERYNENGNLSHTMPKGLEIRTLPHSNIDLLIEEFFESFNIMAHLSADFGLYPVLTSSHPYKSSANKIKDGLNEIECKKRNAEELENALFSMLLHGMHVNISIDGIEKSSLKDVVQKLNYYLPFIIPYSFSSPFWNGNLFEGLSSRNYFQSNKRELIKIVNRKKIDVIQIAAFDACGDLDLLRSLLYLLKALILNQQLVEQLEVPNTSLIQHVSIVGFSDAKLLENSMKVLQDCEVSLSNENISFEYLKNIALTNSSYAMKIQQKFYESKNIMESISNQYFLSDSS